MLKWLHTYHFYPKTFCSLLVGLRATFKSVWSKHCTSELSTYTEEIMPPCQKCIIPGVTLVSDQFCSWSWHPANALDMNQHTQFKPIDPWWGVLPTSHTAPTTCFSTPDFIFCPADKWLLLSHTTSNDQTLQIFAPKVPSVLILDGGIW